jgi:hypothetical protein
MYYIALSEWRLTPEYINRHWTEELLGLMFMKRNESLSELNNPQSKKKVMSDKDLFAKMGVKVRRVGRA